MDRADAPPPNGRSSASRSSARPTGCSDTGRRSSRGGCPARRRRCGSAWPAGRSRCRPGSTWPSAGRQRTRPPWPWWRSRRAPGGWNTGPTSISTPWWKTLRSPAPPFVVATYYTRTGELDVDPVTDELLAAAARRTMAGHTLVVEPGPRGPARRTPNSLCGRCVVLPDCEMGQARVELSGRHPTAGPPAVRLMRPVRAAELSRALVAAAGGFRRRGVPCPSPPTPCRRASPRGRTASEGEAVVVNLSLLRRARPGPSS